MASAILKVRLTPRADRNAIVRYQEGILHARVSAPPVEGSANAALIELLSETLGLRKRAIIIVSGASSREKTVMIEDWTPEQLAERICQLCPGGVSS